MLIAPDTNVLVRIFINDTSDPKQVKAARHLAQKAKQLYISQIVQVELVWILATTYKFTKKQILNILEKLNTHSIFKLQELTNFQHALEQYKNGSADFADYLIWLQSQQVNAQFYTFDKALIKAGAQVCEIN